jgi:hypothetical protein
MLKHLSLVILTAIASVLAETDGYKDAKWGMPRNEVKAALSATFSGTEDGFFEPAEQNGEIDELGNYMFGVPIRKTKGSYEYLADYNRKDFTGWPDLNSESSAKAIFYRDSSFFAYLIELKASNYSAYFSKLTSKYGKGATASTEVMTNAKITSWVSGNTKILLIKHVKGDLSSTTTSLYLVYLDNAAFTAIRNDLRQKALANKKNIEAEEHRPVKDPDMDNIR